MFHKRKCLCLKSERSEERGPLLEWKIPARGIIELPPYFTFHLHTLVILR